jgi:PhnB protein
MSTTPTTITTGQTEQEHALQLAPYVFFYGRCEEALDFYKSIFGGSYELQRTSQTPMADQVSADFREKVMHAYFSAPGITFMASDGRESKTIDPEDGNISLALSAKDRTEGNRAFDALSQGGQVVMALDDAFWGGRFGIVNDRFGTQWLITTP